MVLAAHTVALCCYSIHSQLLQQTTTTRTASLAQRSGGLGRGKVSVYDSLGTERRCRSTDPAAISPGRGRFRRPSAGKCARCRTYTAAVRGREVLLHVGPECKPRPCLIVEPPDPTSSVSEWGWFGPGPKTVRSTIRAQTWFGPAACVAMCECGAALLT